MILIQFPDETTEKKGLGFLVGRFSFRTWDTGETMVPDQALASLARAGIPYSVLGPATYERYGPPPIRNPVAPAV